VQLDQKPNSLGISVSFGSEYSTPAASIRLDGRLSAAKGLLSIVKQATYAHSEFYGL